MTTGTDVIAIKHLTNHQEMIILILIEKHSFGNVGRNPESTWEVTVKTISTRSLPVDSSEISWC